MSNPKDRFIIAREVVKVETPDFGVCHVRKLSALEYLQVRGVGAEFEDTRSTIERSIEMVLISLCDESGSRILEDDDAEIVRAWPETSYGPIIDAIVEVNGLGKAESAQESGSPAKSPNDSSGPTSEGS